MKKIVAILMAMLMVMSVTVVLAGGVAAKDTQPENVDQQIFENKELNVLGEEEFVADEILVKFKHGVGKDKIDKINSKHGAFVRHTSPYTGSQKIGIPKGKTVAEMVKLYQAEDAVEYAEPNYIAHALMVPNDLYYRYQWHLDIPKEKETREWHGENGGGINVEPAWDISTGTEVIVAVIDTGVAYENYKGYLQAPDLASTSFVSGRDFVNNDAHPNDDNSHGTHVTGTIAQTTNNELGVAGVAFNAKIMPVKVLDKSGSGYYSWIADGIRYATDNGAHVISLSLGGSADSETLKNAVKYAYENGVTMIAAAGNNASGTISYPAAYDDYVIAVGATRYDETLAYYSNYGPSLDLVAPGGDLTIDQNGDGYKDGVLQNTFNPNTKNTRDFGYWFFQGTSMATPHVSGVAALLIANGTAATPDEVREILQSTAEDKGRVGWDTYYGWGIVDAHAALLAAGPPNNPPKADNQSVTTPEDTPVDITLTASDVDNDLLTYSIVSGPSHGVLTGTAPNVTYTPNANYNGVDSFTFKANDGKADSNIATVSITVNPVNDAPVANDQSVTTTQNTPVDITLTASDVDNDPLAYSIISGPSYGSLSGTAPSVTYTPEIDYTGSDSFTFEAYDGTVASNIATVSITVTQTAPTMHIININMSQDSRSAGRNIFVWAVATVTIVDEFNNPVGGATVSGQWSNATSDSDSGVTDTFGRVSLKSDSVKNPKTGTTFTFTVDDVVKTDWTYNSSASEETSDSITV